MQDFVNNKIRLGTIQFVCEGVSENDAPAGIPVHSPKPGILNMQYSMKNTVLKEDN